MFKTILFDIDGTLIDSQQYLLEALSNALQTTFNVSLSTKELEQFLGQTDLTIAKMFTSDVDKQQAFALEWTKNVAMQTEPPLLFETVLDTLQVLKKQNVQIGIVTSKTKLHMEQDFNKLHLNDLFDVIVCADMVTNTKPDAEPLLLAMEMLGSSPEHTLYIGDSESDLHCAKHAQVTFGLALWGTKLNMNDPTILYLSSCHDVLNYI